MKEKPTLEELAATANDCHRQCEENLRTALIRAKEAGKALGKARPQLDRGEWMPWVKANFAGSYEKANQYTRISENWSLIEPHLEADPSLSIDRALKCIRSAEPKAEPKAKSARRNLKAMFDLWLDNLSEEEIIQMAEPTTSGLCHLSDHLEIMLDVMRETRLGAA